MSFSPFDAGWLGIGRNPPAERSRIEGSFEGERILVPLLDPTVPAIVDQISVASTLSRAKGASLRVTSPVELPERTPTALRNRIPDEDGGLLAWALEQAATSPPHRREDGGYGRRALGSVLRSIDAYDIDTLVLPGTPRGSVLRRSVTDRLATHADCDVVVVNGRRGYREVPSILLPIAGGPHSGLAADVARCIAAENDAWIDVLHVVEEDASVRRREIAHEYVDAASQRIARPDTTTTWVLDAENAAEAIIEQSQYYGLTVIGAPTAGRLHRFVSGSTNRTIRADAESVVLSVRNNRDPRSVLGDERRRE